MNILSASVLSISVLSAASGADPQAIDILAELTREAAEIRLETRSPEEYQAAAGAYRDLLARAQQLDGDSQGWGDADRIDLRLLRAHLSTRLFEIETLRLHQLIPVSYFALGTTDGLFLRPCGHGDGAVRRAADELRRLPEILENGKKNLTRPARTWTENALYQAYYARLLLRDLVPEVCTEDAAPRDELLRAAEGALVAVNSFETWLKEVLLPRSTRPPTWKPEEIEHYQFVHEQLDDYGVDAMIRIAEEEEVRLLDEMRRLAKRIHPSGDPRTVWEVMKQEAPPWPEVIPMAQRYVDLATAWLQGPGAHLVDIPENFDYDARLNTPMARRILSFGGANYGPTVAGRISGYYVLTPLEDRLSETEKASRIKAYNPYWTHVISYHEWLGHNVQRAQTLAHASAQEARPVRGVFRGSYLSQAWSFYLEKLLEDEGYFEAALPHLEALKTRMARRQMRMWRVQRILTKLKMAKGEMSMGEAVDAYIEKIGMERSNAFIEVQRDSQNPSPPGREIIGERVILEMRDAYQRRLGEHYRMKDFHEQLLRYGELPLPVVRQLMLGGF